MFSSVAGRTIHKNLFGWLRTCRPLRLVKIKSMIMYYVLYALLNMKHKLEFFFQLGAGNVLVSYSGAGNVLLSYI
jgi:hypothetical protein